MEFRLTINCDSDSFHNAECPEYQLRSEIERELVQVIKAIGNYSNDHGTIMDSNGNTIGGWEIAE